VSLSIRLLGRPEITRPFGEAYRFRSRKSWAVLAYLLLSERPPSRAQLASLLFPDADDPVRALRWCLSEVRRGLGEDAALFGDPLVLRLPPGAVVDVDVAIKGAWSDAVELAGLGADLLDGMAVRGSAAFDTWLVSQQRHVAAAAEAILHEAALGSMSRGALEKSIEYAARAAAMNPLDENHQALLIRLYRLAGDDDAAAAQFDSCVQLFSSELGVSPGAAVHEAIRESRDRSPDVVDVPTAAAILEAGAAAVAAGAVDSGITSLRTAVRLADSTSATDLRIRSRLVLGEALIHSLGGRDEEGIGSLHEADTIALRNDDHHSAAQARAELGYVDYLRARYGRAEIWLTDALALAENSSVVRAKALTYLGGVSSDQADYGRAGATLAEAIGVAQAGNAVRTEAFARSLLGRVHLLSGELGPAADQLNEAIDLASRDHWLAFLPWPQALAGDVRLLADDLSGAAGLLEQAFARACQLGNPCWEGTAARGLARLAEATGDATRAFEILADAVTRSSRLADPYMWLAVYILDTQCEFGRRHGHPDTPRWIDRMQELASRTGMRDLAVRSLVHGAAAGREGDAVAASLLAAEIDNPRLLELVSALELPVDRLPRPRPPVVLGAGARQKAQT
jgi:DNA-binding SARP family transcriptional activator